MGEQREQRSDIRALMEAGLADGYAPETAGSGFMAAQTDADEVAAQPQDELIESGVVTAERTSSPTSTNKIQEQPKGLTIEDFSSDEVDLSVRSMKPPPLPEKTPVVVEDEADVPERDVAFVAYGPRGGWYVRWTDGTTAWEGMPPGLHARLHGRPRGLPGVRWVSVSEMGVWVAVFADGSFASSGFSVSERLRTALHDPPGDSELKTLTFAPGGGWLLTRMDGSVDYERLPSGLNELLRRRTAADAPIDVAAISGFGGWFIRFSDGECEWEAIPKPLENLLIRHIRHGDPHIVVALCPTDGHSYFAAVGETAEWVHDSSALRTALEWANSDSKVPNNVPDSVSFSFTSLAA